MDSSNMKITYKAIQDRAKDVAKEYAPDLPDIPERQLYADSALGVYIPQHFAESVDRDCVSGIDLSDLDQLAQGPDSCESYWDIWTDVEADCVLTDSDGQQWRIWQDGDLWLVPVDAVEAWESFQRAVEEMDAHEIAHESSEWDWVIYYHRALELCQAVPSDVLHEAESEAYDSGGIDHLQGYGCDRSSDNFGLYEMAVLIADQIVTRAIVDAVESLKEELIDMAETQLENM